MSYSELDHAAQSRTRRSWLIEALVIGGVLAFGAFAMFADAPEAPLNMIRGFFG